MTKSGIEYDLKVSPYVTEVVYPGGRTIDYHFSSALNHRKFKEGLEKNREDVKASLCNRFKMIFFLSDELCDLHLYRRIEGRGFYIRINKEGYEWPGKLSYDGRKIVS